MDRYTRLGVESKEKNIAAVREGNQDKREGTIASGEGEGGATEEEDKQDHQGILNG